VQDGPRLQVPGGAVGVLAIVRLRRREPDDALLAALVDGGVRAVEVTLPTPGALAAVRRWAGEERVTVGVGTVRTPADAHAAADAGAAFLVTPTVRPDVLAAAAARGLPVLCGALTPTEIDLAWSCGAAGVKVFPAAQVGGPAYLRAVREPLDDVALLPTGGVDVAAARAYAADGCLGVGVGSALVAERLLEGGADGGAGRAAAGLDEVRERARAFVSAWADGVAARA
jgi:2-dehydro-3-deoxyphosphogluconate aldolase/(4S)-4-hydroxy-2-oxoglutarate aldolase